MNKWTIGTFYTDNTVYEQVFNQYLAPSLKKFPLNCTYTCANNYGNWYRNVAEKPRIILDQLCNIPSDTCLVFLDADATVEKYPEVFDTIPDDIDIAFHLLSWRDWYGYNSDMTELLTGTMFFRNNEIVHNLCKEWHQEAIKTREWEQKVLEKILDKHPVKVYHLPLEYCYMKSRPRGQEPLVKLDPVILHHQVSRELKKQVL